MYRTAAAALVFATLSTAASAVTFTGTTVGNWTNPNATQGFGIYNYDTGNATYDQSYAVWGYTNCTTCTSFNNYWAFDGVGSDGDAPWATNGGDLFNFGQLSYRNGSVYGHDFVGAQLSLSLAISSPLSVVTAFNFDLEVENVPNDTGNAVTDGDIAKITSPVADQFFSFDGKDYTLELLGFSRDNGQTLATQFQVPEASTDSVALYGRITEVAAVPLPASLPLALMGLAPFAWVARRRS